VQRGKDSNDLHTELYGIAVAEQDQAAIERENAIRERDSDKYYFYYAKAQAAFMTGRYKEGVRLLGAAHDTAEREGLSEAADEVLLDEASYQHDFDLDAEARATLKQIRKPDPDSVFIAILKTQLGNAVVGQHFLEQEESSNPQGTLMKFFYLPVLRSELQMTRGKPQDAIAALEPARRYELTTYDIPRARGEAYLKANEPKMAETEFKKVIEHYGVEPTSSDIPLSHLGLARAYALDGDKTGSRNEYQKLFALWKDADPDLPVLLEAHRESARLQ
jgi:eukaryotic-like serine/threonine-protein kinase